MFRYLSEKFQIISIIDVAPFYATSMTKFGQFVAVLCISNGWFPFTSHIRIYEDIHPFSLLFVIYTGKLGFVFDIKWNKKTESLFIRSDSLGSDGIWEIKWEDHLVKKFSCPSAVSPEFMSISNDGDVLIIEQKDNHLYVCKMNEVLVRKIPFVQKTQYDLHYSPFGEYRFHAAHYDPRLNVQMDSVQIDLSLNGWRDFNVESSPNVKRTHESDIESTKIKRFSFFILNRAPENCDDIHVFNVTIERRIKIKMNLTTEYSASDENLIDMFLPNIGNEFIYWFSYNATICFDPSAQMMKKHLIVSYYYDSDTYQLIVGLSNAFDDKDQKVVIFRTQK